MGFEGFLSCFFVVVVNLKYDPQVSYMVRKLPKRAILEHFRKISVFDHI